MFANPVFGVRFFWQPALGQNCSNKTKTQQLLLRLRGRVHEAGAYLSLGRPKGEILGQFALEAVALLVLGFLLALLLWALCCGGVNRLLFGSLAQEAGAEALANYLRPNILRAGALLAGEGAAVLLAAATVLRCKPKDILSQME